MADLKVVITDLGYATYEPEREQLAALRQAQGGPAGDVELVLAECVTEADVAEACKDADGVITRLAPVGPDAIGAMQKCRVISRYGVGVDNVDVPAATAKSIPVCNVRGYCNEDVSDHALALLMSCVRRTASRDKQVRAGEWDIGSKEPIYRVAGKTLGLVGYGAIPRVLHRKVSGFGLKEVLIFDPYVSDEDANAAGVRKVSLDELCEGADFISIHAPLNDETRHMIGPDQGRRSDRTAGRAPERQNNVGGDRRLRARAAAEGLAAVRAPERRADRPHELVQRRIAARIAEVRSEKRRTRPERPAAALLCQSGSSGLITTVRAWGNTNDAVSARFGATRKVAGG